MRERAGTLVCHQSRFLLVELEDPTGQRFVLPPGGSVESGESPQDAACRETLEETGHRVQLLERPSSQLRYDFLWGTQVFQCQTDFFGARWDEGPLETVADPLVRGVKWLAWDEVRLALDFHPALRDHLLPHYRNLMAK